MAASVGLATGLLVGRAQIQSRSVEQAERSQQDTILTCYYAHPMSIYGTPQESEDIHFLQSLGYQVINPNVPEYKDRSKDMAFFCKLAANADLVAFRALPNGRISPGVALELKVAKRKIELPNSVEQRSEHFP